MADVQRRPSAAAAAERQFSSSFFSPPLSLSLSLFCSVVYLKTRERKRTDAPPIVAFLSPFFLPSEETVQHFRHMDNKQLKLCIAPPTRQCHTHSPFPPARSRATYQRVVQLLCFTHPVYYYSRASSSSSSSLEVSYDKQPFLSPLVGCWTASVTRVFIFL